LRLTDRNVRSVGLTGYQQTDGMHIQ